MERFIKVEIFQKKVIPFELHYRFPVLTETTEIFFTVITIKCYWYFFGTENRNRIELYHLQNTCKLFTFS